MFTFGSLLDATSVLALVLTVGVSIVVGMTVFRVGKAGAFGLTARQMARRKGRVRARAARAGRKVKRGRGAGRPVSARPVRPPLVVASALAVIEHRAMAEHDKRPPGWMLKQETADLELFYSKRYDPASGKWVDRSAPAPPAPRVTGRHNK